MNIIEAVPILLGILSGFVTGVIAGRGLYRSHSSHHDRSMETLDKLLLGLSILAAFVLGVFISLVFK